MKFEKLNTIWNADPNAPEPLVWKAEGNIIVDFFLNYFVYKQFNEGDRARVVIRNCARFSFNFCNDEGYYRGQYRFGPNTLPWGEFYELTEGFDDNFPEPIELIRPVHITDRHFIFFFRDHTLEILAADYEFSMVRESQPQQQLLRIMWEIWTKIDSDSDVVWSRYADFKEAKFDIENLIMRIRKSDKKIIDDLGLYFGPTGTFQELSLSNGWEDDYLRLADEFDQIEIEYRNRKYTE